MAEKIPPLTPVQSSNIQSMGHDGHRLFVRFSGGGLYSYGDVPRRLYEEGLEADSVGRWFRENIKGHFLHVQHDA